MKSKAISSILRHIASKMPSLDANGESITGGDIVNDIKISQAAQDIEQGKRGNGLDSVTRVPRCSTSKMSLLLSD